MRRLVLMTAVLSLLGGMAEAKDVLPPVAGSACDVTIRDYLTQSGHPLKSVIRIDANVERDGKMYFMAVGREIFKAWKSINLTQLTLPIIEDPAIVKEFDYPNVKHGMWMVLTEGRGDLKKALVFGMIPDGTCIRLFQEPVDFDASQLPKSLMSH